MVRVCIHRGTKEIGGTCVEVESQGKRIVLDVGLPLDVVDPAAMPLHAVPGFDKPDPSLLGVVISHPHQDHYGLAYRLPEETTFLIGQGAESILEAADAFTTAGLRLKHVIHLKDRCVLRLGLRKESRQDAHGTEGFCETTTEAQRQVLWDKGPE